jgi:hypothetical protein
LPLLQTNLRGKIRRALTTLVNILEHIQRFVIKHCLSSNTNIYLHSLNWLLRSQAHFELAKIEEDIEQLDSAKTNLLKVE